MGYSPWGCKESDTTCHLSTHYVLEPYILGCEVKWALRSLIMNTASGGDGIPAELFKILKDDAAKTAAVIMPSNLENSAVATGLEKVTFHSSP